MWIQNQRCLFLKVLSSFFGERGMSVSEGNNSAQCMEIYLCCCCPPPLVHLFPPSVCSPCWCAFGDRCRPSRANIYFNSLIFSSISLKYSHSVCSVKLWDERHNQQQFPPYLPVWYVWTYFHMLWTVPDSKPTAAHCRETLVVWRCFRFRAVIRHTLLCCHSTTFLCHFPLMTPSAYTSKVQV